MNCQTNNKFNIDILHSLNSVNFKLNCIDLNELLNNIKY